MAEPVTSKDQVAAWISGRIGERCSVSHYNCTRCRAWEAFDGTAWPAPEPCAECQRMREGLQLMATDEHRLMNITARQTAQSILNGKPSGVAAPPPGASVPLWLAEAEVCT